MTVVAFFLIAGLVMIAPHVDEFSAKVYTLLFLFFALIAWGLE